MYHYKLYGFHIVTDNKFVQMVEEDASKADADKTIEAIKAAGEEAFVIGKTVAGDKGVTIC